jgi:hypothetical protein
MMQVCSQGIHRQLGRNNMEKTQQVKKAKKSDAAFEMTYPISKKNRFSVWGV